jgi:quinohemoprotein ethanol dehydrogenase
VWHYQTTPGETWDYTAVQQLTLATLPIDGRERKVILQAPKNGFFYVLDRLTGELLSAEPYVPVTWASGIDRETGRPIETAHARYASALTTIAPGPGGGHNWQPMSFNPSTGLVYIPAAESTFAYVADRSFEFRPRAWNLAVDLAAAFGARTSLPQRSEAEYSPGTGKSGGAASSLLAWDPVTQTERWRVRHTSTTGGGTLTTAGNLVFQGTADGRFVAYGADSGAKLWEMQLGDGILAAPATYALDGKQYVSILVGWGGAGGLYAANPFGHYKASGRLWTFVLDGDADFVPVRGIDRPPLTPIEFEASSEAITHGRELYAARCSMCHGLGAASGGGIADLRYAAPATYEALDAIVRGGAYAALGMPQFDWLSGTDVDSIRSYLLAQRAALLATQPVQ